MGPFATAVLVGCLDTARWLAWLLAALLPAMLVTQYLRGDADARPDVFLPLTVIACVVGWVCGRLARWLEAHAA